jgi:hypothetical protein
MHAVSYSLPIRSLVRAVPDRLAAAGLLPGIACLSGFAWLMLVLSLAMLCMHLWSVSMYIYPDLYLYGSMYV